MIHIQQIWNSSYRVQNAGLEMQGYSQRENLFAAEYINKRQFSWIFDKKVWFKTILRNKVMKN